MNLSLHTAEGIENKEILDRLRQYGDIKGQGFLYGHPQPADETRDRLASLDLLREEAEAKATNPASEDGQASKVAGKR